MMRHRMNRSFPALSRHVAPRLGRTLGRALESGFRPTFVAIAGGRELAALGRHAGLLWRSGLLRFRLETFGTYYPGLPYEAPRWRLSARPTLLLVRRSRSYARWLLEMDDVRRTGAHGWWERHGVTWEGVLDD